MAEKQISFWAKHQRYRYVEKDGVTFVAPKDISSRWEYNPVEIENEILCDALNLGKTLTEHPNSHNKVIMLFVNKYGLLGILPDLTETNMDVYNRLVIHDNIFYPPGVVLTQPFVQFFFPCEESLINNESVINDSYQGRDSSFTKLFLTGRYYAEPLDWIEKYLKYLYGHMDIDIAGLALFNKPRITYRIENIDDQPTLVREYASLKAVIDFAFAKAITDDRKPLRYCKHCGTIFYAKDVRSEFCSPRCRNQFNVYKYRAKS